MKEPEEFDSITGDDLDRTVNRYDYEMQLMSAPRNPGEELADGIT